LAEHIVDAYKVAAVVSIHEPERGNDERNHHAHILYTTRPVKDAHDVDGKRIAILTDKAGPCEVKKIRLAWEEMCNDALAKHNTKISMLSYYEQHDKGITPIELESKGHVNREEHFFGDKQKEIAARNEERLDDYRNTEASLEEVELYESIAAGAFDNIGRVENDMGERIEIDAGTSDGEDIGVGKTSEGNKILEWLRKDLCGDRQSIEGETILAGFENRPSEYENKQVNGNNVGHGGTSQDENREPITEHRESVEGNSTVLRHPEGVNRSLGQLTRGVERIHSEIDKRFGSVVTRISDTIKELARLCQQGLKSIIERIKYDRTGTINIGDRQSVADGRGIAQGGDDSLRRGIEEPHRVISSTAGRDSENIEQDIVGQGGKPFKDSCGNETNLGRDEKIERRDQGNRADDADAQNEAEAEHETAVGGASSVNGARINNRRIDGDILQKQHHRPDKLDKGLRLEQTVQGDVVLEGGRSGAEENHGSNLRAGGRKSPGEAVGGADTSVLASLAAGKLPAMKSNGMLGSAFRAAVEAQKAKAAQEEEAKKAKPSNEKRERLGEMILEYEAACKMPISTGNTINRSAYDTITRLRGKLDAAIGSGMEEAIEMLPEALREKAKKYRPENIRQLLQEQHRNGEAAAISIADKKHAIWISPKAQKLKIKNDNTEGIGIKI